MYSNKYGLSDCFARIVESLNNGSGPSKDELKQ